MTSRKYCFTTLVNPFGVSSIIRPIPHKFCFAKPMGCDGAKKTTLFMQHNFRVAMPKKLLRVAFAIRPIPRKFCFAKPMGCDGAKETTLFMQHNFRVAMPKKPLRVTFTIRPIHHKFCFVKPMGCDGAEETAASTPFHSCFAAPFNITSLHLIFISQYLFL